ncbi:MAG: glutamate--cysteine ligase, partial [Hyphomonadaceae bacterium]
SSLCAFSAFWTGLLYCDEAVDAAWQLVKDWSAPEREAVRQSARVLGLKTPVPGGRTLQDIALEVLALSRLGLKNRAKLSSSGDDETGYLTELDEIARTGITPAERLLEHYHGVWGRDVKSVFEAMAY